MHRFVSHIIFLSAAALILSCGSEAGPLPEDPKDWEGLPCGEDTPAFACTGRNTIMNCHEGIYVANGCAVAYSEGSCWFGEVCEPEVGCSLLPEPAGWWCYKGACAADGRCLTREEWEGEPCEEPHSFCFLWDMAGGSPVYAARCNVEEKQYEVLTCTESFNSCTNINCRVPEHVCEITNLEAGSVCAAVDHGNLISSTCDENGHCGGIASD